MGELFATSILFNNSVIMSSHFGRYLLTSFCYCYCFCYNNDVFERLLLINITSSRVPCRQLGVYSGGKLLLLSSPQGNSETAKADDFEGLGFTFHFQQRKLFSADNWTRNLCDSFALTPGLCRSETKPSVSSVDTHRTCISMKKLLFSHY